MAISRIMTKNVVCVDMDITLLEIKEIFRKKRFHHMLVTSNDKLVGIVSDRDVLKNISPFVDTAAETAKDLHTLQKRAHQIMSRRIISVPPHAKLITAIRTFNDNKVSCLPVVDDNQKVLGIVSWRDILRYTEALFDSKKKH